MQTLDNLLMNGQIDIVDYLERVPNGYIVNQQALIDKLKGQRQQMSTSVSGPLTPSAETQSALVGGSGYGTLQRKINETGEVKV